MVALAGRGILSVIPHSLSATSYDALSADDKEEFSGFGRNWQVWQVPGSQRTHGILAQLPAWVRSRLKLFAERRICHSELFAFFCRDGDERQR
jgi:hypothetical protein